MMNSIRLTTYFGDEFIFEQESGTELSLFVNNVDLGTIKREDVIELVGFLSQFIDGDI